MSKFEPPDDLSPDLKFFSQGRGNQDFCKHPPGLYVVSTPLGNCEDITLRALRVLKEVDLIACEDTRHSQKLLKMFGITTRLLCYNDHNASRVRPHLLQRLEEGQRIALISDAGTPLIADPGYKLVQASIAQGHLVTALPGPCAAIVGLTLSGLPTDQFYFGGFPPGKSTARQKYFAALKTIPGTLIFYESPHRLVACLKDLETVFGPREAALARELTKFFEEMIRGPLSGIREEMEEREGKGTLKGEMVIVVAGTRDQTVSEEVVIQLIQDYRSQKSLRETVVQVVEETGVARKKVYEIALKLEKDREQNKK